MFDFVLRNVPLICATYALHPVGDETVGIPPPFQPGWIPPPPPVPLFFNATIQDAGALYLTLYFDTPMPATDFFTSTPPWVYRSAGSPGTPGVLVSGAGAKTQVYLNCGPTDEPIEIVVPAGSVMGIAAGTYPVVLG